MKRTSRRLRPNERQWTTCVSPLDYTGIGIPKGAVERVALVDTDAPPIPTKFSEHFVPRYETTKSMRAPKGHPQQGEWITKPLKKPKLVSAGAPPNTVAFLDYQIYGPSGRKQVYVQYMAVRSDLRRRGYGRDLLSHFMDALQVGGVAHVNFGKVLNQRMWEMVQLWENEHAAGRYVPGVSGKRYF